MTIKCSLFSLVLHTRAQCITISLKKQHIVDGTDGDLIEQSDTFFFLFQGHFSDSLLKIKAISFCYCQLGLLNGYVFILTLDEFLNKRFKDYFSSHWKSK